MLIMLAVTLGLAVCHLCYYAIHRRQMVPVLASATATLWVLLLVKFIPALSPLDQEAWHLFWFGSSFCGMNNNRYISVRTVALVWLAYALLFWLLHAHQPWPGGSLGSMAVLVSALWMVGVKTFNHLRRRPRPPHS